MKKSVAEEIIHDLQLIETTTPDYIEGRNRGLNYKETEQKANNAINKAMFVLQQLDCIGIIIEGLLEDIPYKDLSKKKIVAVLEDVLKLINDEK